MSLIQKEWKLSKFSSVFTHHSYQSFFSSDKSAKEGDEEIIVPEKLKKPDEEKSQKSGLKEKIIKKVKEEIVKKVV